MSLAERMHRDQRAGRRLTVPAMAVLAALAAFAAGAQQDLERPPEIPPIDAPDQPIPPKIQDEQIEPTVTIREEEDRTVEEYRYNGQVYMVKVTPSVGPPYYFIDTDGDGSLETAPDKGLEPVKPVQWKIKEFD